MAEKIKLDRGGKERETERDEKDKERHGKESNRKKETVSDMKFEKDTVSDRMDERGKEIRKRVRVSNLDLEKKPETCFFFF